MAPTPRASSVAAAVRDGAPSSAYETTRSFSTTASRAGASSAAAMAESVTPLELSRVLARARAFRADDMGRGNQWYLELGEQLEPGVPVEPLSALCRTDGERQVCGGARRPDHRTGATAPDRSRARARSERARARGQTRELRARHDERNDVIGRGFLRAAGSARARAVFRRVPAEPPSFRREQGL